MLTMHAMSTLSLKRDIVLFGSAAAAFVAGIYVIWGPSQKKRSKRKGTNDDVSDLGNDMQPLMIEQRQQTSGNAPPPTKPPQETPPPTKPSRKRPPPTKPPRKPPPRTKPSRKCPQEMPPRKRPPGNAPPPNKALQETPPPPRVQLCHGNKSSWILKWEKDLTMTS